MNGEEKWEDAETGKGEEKEETNHEGQATLKCCQLFS